MSLIQKSIDKVSVSIISRTNLKLGDTVNFSVSPNLFSEVVENQFISALKHNSIIVVQKNISQNFLQITPIDCKINYQTISQNFFTENLIERNIGFECEAKFLKNDVVIFVDKFTSKIKDTIMFSQIEEVENNLFPITVGNKNDIVNNEDLFEYSIFVGTFAVITFLFFYIRN